MSSGDSFQCSSMDDDDDELEGNSPTSIWRRNRKRKDYSDDEDYKPDEEEMEKEEAEEKEYKPFVDRTYCNSTTFSYLRCWCECERVSWKQEADGTHEHRREGS